MSDSGIDVCIIPTADCHESEYVAPYFQVREFFSGFNGSAGTLIVGTKDAALYTDSRYFIQAEYQLKGSGIELKKEGLPETIPVSKYLYDSLPEGGTLGFDGKVINARLLESIKKGLNGKNIIIKNDFNMSEGIWNDRPQIEFNSQKLLDDSLTGETTNSKIDRIRSYMEKYNSKVHVVTLLDDIAWIMNMRGKDIECNPVFFAYMLITLNQVHLYAKVYDKSVEEYIVNKCNVILHDYDDFYEDLRERVKKWTDMDVLLDLSAVNTAIIDILGDSVRLIDTTNPATIMKSVKNQAEIEAMKQANIADGVAMVHFEKYLKDCIEQLEPVNYKENSYIKIDNKLSGDFTEIGLQEKLYEFRCEDKDMSGPSFETICAYGAHGAIVHYSSTKETNVEIEGGSFLLIDSGAQYPGATTDVTRTYAIGNVGEKLKRDYTMVLKAMLRIMDFTFPEGAIGQNIDVIARNVFWERGMDFGHGTGHGIGAGLCVHEGPVRLAWKYTPQRTPVIFTPGMITSDEPGVYIEGEYGIRIETDVLCVKKYSNSYGNFLGFEPLTLVPIDKKGIFIEDMSLRDIEVLNEYHRKVYEALAPRVEGEVLEYLKDATSPL